MEKMSYILILYREAKTSCMIVTTPDLLVRVAQSEAQAIYTYIYVYVYTYMYVHTYIYIYIFAVGSITWPP